MRFLAARSDRTATPSRGNAGAPPLPGLLRCPDPDPQCPCHADAGAGADIAGVLGDVGRPLDPSTLLSMGALFGHDFGGVRVHSDERAAASAQAVHALAYTVGPHIAFAAGRYAPDTPAGARLLAHELAHVVQQGGRAAPAALRSVVDHGRTAEAAQGAAAALDREADDAAADVMVGRRPRLNHAAPAELVQRQASPGGVEDVSLQQRDESRARRPAPRGLPEGVSITAKQNVRCGRRRVDAILTTEPEGHATLTIEVRTWFIFMPDRGKWELSEQQKWQDTFVRRVNEKWSTKHYLEPTELCPDLPVPRVAVRVRCAPVPAGSPHHIVAAVYRDTPLSRSADGVERRSHLDPTTRPPTVRMAQTDIESSGGLVTGEHEFGHALGIDHVACSTNDDACYGRGDEADDVMGKGGTVSTRDYEVFAQLLRREFTPGCAWVVKQASAQPRNLFPTLMALGLGSLGLLAGMALGPVGALVGGLAGAVAGGLLGHFSGGNVPG